MWFGNYNFLFFCLSERINLVADRDGVKIQLYIENEIIISECVIGR